MIQKPLTHRASALLAVVLLLSAACGSAVAAGKKPKKAATAAPGKSAKFIRGSQETPKERSTRLKRECKGAVNAGACEGHTQ